MEETFKKNINSELNEISSFFLNENFIFNQPGHPIDGGKLNLFKRADEKVISFELDLNQPINPDDITFKKLGLTIVSKIVSEKYTYCIPKKGVTKISAKSFIASEKIKGEISSIYTESFPLKTPSFFRLIFQINEQYGITNFLGSRYSCGETHYSLGLIILEIGKNKYHVFRHCYNKKIYLIFEVQNIISFDSFKIDCDSIQKSIAFLKGNYHKDEHYFFSYDSLNFEKPTSLYFNDFGDSIISNFELINPQQFRTFMKISDEKLILSSLLFPEKTLSNLASLVKLKPQLDRTLDLIIYGNDIRSPLIRCSTFSVALETIVSLIHSENKSAFKPLKQSNKLAKIQLDLQAVIDNSKNELSEQEYIFISKKISYLNTSFNKDKYLLAFNFLKIELPEYLKNLLNTRNLFFHGKTPYEEGELNAKIPDLHLEADRIHMLVSILVLKYAGYRGHIKNQAGYRLAMKNIYDDLENEVVENSFYKI